MNLNCHQIALLKLLIEHDVKFLVIGGHAVLEYSNHRTTYDLDILLSRSKDNARKAANVFSRFRDRAPNGKEWEVALTCKEVRLAYPIDNIHEADLLTSIEGIDFGVCYRNAKTITIENLKILIPDLHDLIDMKMKSLTSGNDAKTKQKDQIDIDELRKLLPS